MLDELKKQPIWLNWKLETRDGKSTKVPYQRSGRFASSTDPKTWCTFEEAETYRATGDVSGVGIVFEKTCGVIGVDFDHCVLEEDIPENIREFLLASKTYCEYSPSKTGLHVLFITKEEIEIETHKHYFDSDSHIEIYTHGRYFTFTEDEMRESVEIRVVSGEEFISLLNLLGYPWQKTLMEKKSEEIDEGGREVKGEEIPDEELKRKMFSSKNGQKIKQLFDGNISDYNDDYSSADFALCSHLAFWTQKNEVQMERLWLGSELGKREKTISRADYRERTIRGANDVTSKTYSRDGNGKLERESYDFLMVTPKDKEPYPLLVFSNIARILRKHPRFVGKFRRNDFSHLAETCFGTHEWIALNDEVVLTARDYIVENFSVFRKVSKDTMVDAILAVANENRINPPRDYFTSLVWDGKPRLNSWLYSAYGVADDELHQAIGSNWIKGLVKRVMKPGCQFDEVLALESPQGWRKSSSVRALGQPWHVETAHSIDNKDFYLLLAQNIIVEFSEGEIFDRASVKKLKAEITKTEDQVRPPYERGIMKFKRSCVFAVTTNKLELKDDTGNRRWLPVTLGKPADVEWILKWRDQLFAEAFLRVIVRGESTHEYPTVNLEDLQASRAEWSDYSETLLFWYAELDFEKREKEGIALHEACRKIYGEEIEIRTREEREVATLIRRSLYLEPRNKKLEGAVLKRWFPTEKTRKIILEINKRDAGE